MLRRVSALVLCILVLGCSSTEDANKDKAVRMRFEPGAAPTTPFEEGNSASWTALAPFPRTDSERLTVMAHAGIGNKFPVAKKDGPTLFEVILKDGNDKRLSLEIVSGEGTRNVEVKLDKPVQVVVAGVEYTITYPTIEVAASANRTATNKATIFVSTPNK